MRRLLIILAAAFAPPLAAQGSVEDRLDDFDRRLRNIEQLLGPSAELQAGLEALRADFEAQPRGGLNVTYKDGLRFEGDDVKLRIGGRIHTDFTHGSESGDFDDFNGDVEDGVLFRRARIFMEGEFHDRIKTKAQYDFAGGDADFKDVYMEFKDLPVVNDLRVGQFKEPMGLEELTSSNYISLIERSLMNVFMPSRNTGVMSSHTLGEDDRGTLAVGAFRSSGKAFGDPDGDGFGDDNGDGEGAVTGRVTYLPYYEEDGRKLVHVGASMSKRSPDGDMVSFEASPESKRAPTVVSTGAIPADSLVLTGLEAAFVNGPFSLQGEFARADIAGKSSATGADPTFDGGYVQASYFLTGEHRPYKKSSGEFGRVAPNEPWTTTEGGIGAWEATARWSHIDLTDDAVAGGDVEDVTLGLNWYLDRNTRIMFNTIESSVDDEGDASLYIVRFQRDF